MSKGPGKYDDLCTYVLEQSEAAAAIVIILAGNNGSGFSVQAPRDVAVTLPALLRKAANEIERDWEG